MDVNLEHSENATLSIVLSCEPEVNIIDTKLIQVKNAFSPIDVTNAGMAIDLKLIQFMNAISPIDVTEAGMTIDFKPVQPLKADLTIVLTELGMINVDPDFP